MKNMPNFLEWLESRILLCQDDKDLQREHWAFCQCFKKYRELVDADIDITNKNKLVEKFTDRIITDYPEADKIHIDLIQFLQESNY